MASISASMPGIGTQLITGPTGGAVHFFRLAAIDAIEALSAIGTSGYSKVTNAVTPTAAHP